MASKYSIKDLEHLSGIKAHTLRIWEQRYSIINPKRTDTNIRYYDNTDLKLILNISLLKDSGYKISEIAKMSPADMCNEINVLTEKTLQFPDQVQALTISMIDLDEDRFEKIMNTNILRFGFEETMINIIYPFLSRIGLLWQTGAINPAQEHFISNLIRQKIIVAIDAQIIKQRPNSKKFLLFLPDGELHEISLLFANYLIRCRGNRAIYLGQSLPFEDLRATFDVHVPDYLLTIVTSTPGQDDIQQYIYKLAHYFPNTRILITGFQVLSQELTIPDNITILKQLHELSSFVENH